MKILGQHEAGTPAQFEDVRSRAVDAALMANGHFGYVQPVGGVTAYRNRASVVGVGFDIVCGNAAIRTDTQLADLGGTPDAVRAALTDLADGIYCAVSFGVGRGAGQAPAGPARAGPRPARHRGQRQPLRGRVRRRGGRALGGRALRQPRLRPRGRTLATRPTSCTTGSGPGSGSRCTP